MMAYLDLDQLLDPVDDEHVLVAFGRLPEHGFVSSAHPAILKGFFGGLLVVQVSENNRRRSNDEFAWLIVACDLDSFRCQQLSFEAGKQASR